MPPGTNGGVSPLGCACSAAAGVFIGGAAWTLAAALGDASLAPPGGLASAAGPLARAALGGGRQGSGGGAAGLGGGGGAAEGEGAAAPAAAAAAQFWVGLGLAAGVAGSLVDSLLGATVQYSGVDARSGKVVGCPGPGVRRVSGRPWLSNDAVNAAAAAAASLGAAAAAWRAAAAAG